MNLEKRIIELEDEQLITCCDMQEGAKLSDKKEKRFSWVNKRLGQLQKKKEKQI